MTKLTKAEQMKRLYDERKAQGLVELRFRGLKPDQANRIRTYAKKVIKETI